MKVVMCLLLLVLAACAADPSTGVEHEVEAPEPQEQKTDSSPAAQEVEQQARSSDDLRVNDQEVADATRIGCERLRARASIFVADPETISLEELTNEGGFAHVFRRDEEIIRIYGERLTETTRLRFDFIFDNGQLACVRETVSNVHVIMEDEFEDWDHYWHHQHLVFADGEVVSVAQEHTGGADGLGREVSRIRDFANAVSAAAAGE